MSDKTKQVRRIGNWCETYTGKKFYPADPRVEEIDLEDITHALGNICRFGGHSSRFYSVAQHSIVVASLVSEENRLWALLHDAAEAYVGDIPRPLKMMLPRFCDIESRIIEKIAEAWGLPAEMPAEIKQADNFALFLEATALGMDTKRWSLDFLFEIKDPLQVQHAKDLISIGGFSGDYWRLRLKQDVLAAVTAQEVAKNAGE